MQPLNFPTSYAFDLRTVDGKDEIFDVLRRKYVRLTPEEWVRQHVLHHLLRDLGFPGGRTAVEIGFSHQGVFHRADVVVYNRQGRPLLMVECKAPEVRINQRVIDQIARYNAAVQAKYLVVTNGLQHYCWTVDAERNAYRFLDRIPPHGELEPPGSQPRSPGG